MRKLALVASATLSLVLLAGGAPAYAADITLPDVPAGFMPPDEGSAGASSQCRTKSAVGEYPDPPQPKRSTFCVYHDVDKVWGAINFEAPAWGSGNDVYFDLDVYRCRISDNVCVQIASIYEHRRTNAFGRAYAETPQTTQTWDGRYYKACASMSSSIGFGYGRTCTDQLTP